MFNSKYRAYIHHPKQSRSQTTISVRCKFGVPIHTARMRKSLNNMKYKTYKRSLSTKVPNTVRCQRWCRCLSPNRLATPATPAQCDTHPTPVSDERERFVSCIVLNAVELSHFWHIKFFAQCHRAYCLPVGQNCLRNLQRYMLCARLTLSRNVLRASLTKK